MRELGQQGARLLPGDKMSPKFTQYSEREPTGAFSMLTEPTRAFSLENLKNLTQICGLQAGDIRRRLSECVNAPRSKSGFKRDPEDPSAAVLKEPWEVRR